MSPIRHLLVATGLLLAVPASAHAHLQIVDPAPRYLDQKNGPCGSTNDVRSDNITEVSPGATITIRWLETIDHPSHYRISFSAHGVEDLVDPTDFDDFYAADSVLLDEIADKEGGEYSQEVTLPNVECDRCTLQLIQVMYDKPPWGPAGGNDIYYQCVDLVVRSRDPSTDGSDPGIDPGSGPPGETVGGCQTGTDRPGATGLLMVVFLSAPGFRTRRQGGKTQK